MSSLDRHCERSEAIQKSWIYPYGARKLRNIITAAPLTAVRDDEADGLHIAIVAGRPNIPEETGNTGGKACVTAIDLIEEI